MYMMEKSVSLILAVLTTLCILVSCGNVTGAKELKVIDSKSYFSEYTVEEQTVNIKFCITIKNQTDTNVTFKLIGDFSKDEGVLVKNRRIIAKEISTGEEKLSIQPKEEKTFELVFIDAYAGTNQKKDRLLPEISFEILE